MFRAARDVASGCDTVVGQAGREVIAAPCRARYAQNRLSAPKVSLRDSYGKSPPETTTPESRERTVAHEMDARASKRS